MKNNLYSEEFDNGIRIYTGGYIDERAWDIAKRELWKLGREWKDSYIVAEYGIHGDGYRLYDEEGNELCRFDIEEEL